MGVTRLVRQSFPTVARRFVRVDWVMRRFTGPIAMTPVTVACVTAVSMTVAPVATLLVAVSAVAVPAVAGLSGVRTVAVASSGRYACFG